MSELAAFVEARLAEDEALARMEYERGLPDDPALGWVETESGDWALDVSPARVLLEVAAKRAILALFPDAAADGDGWNEAGVQVLELLAAPYVSHPGFDERWTTQ